MSIRLKLYMSYLAMAVVPVILLFLFIMILYASSGKQDIRDLTDAKQNENFNQALVYGELTYVLREDTGQMQHAAFLSDLQERLSRQWAGVILSKGGVVTEVSPFLRSLDEDKDWQKLADEPPSKLFFQSYRFTSHEMVFQYPDGDEGKVLLLYRTEQVPFFWHPLTMILSLLSILLTSLLLTYFVSRSIIKPLQSLRSAALQIKEGNLAQALPMAPPRQIGKSRFTHRDEVAQLGAAFEEMRARLKLSIDQSLQYEENRKLLLSHISHDLKTPISAIKGYVEGIMDGIANTDEKRSRYMGTIYRKASEMDHLIDELFLFSKLDLQKVAYDFKVVDIARYVDDYLEEQRFELEKYGITLELRNEAMFAGLQVAADPDKLNRVFANILSNGIKYMNQLPEQSGNRVLVTVTASGDDALIIFEDTGPGIDDSDLPHIFDGFYRAEQSRNSETGGSGLGLAIVKQIVEGHGGSVWAENAAAGGAKFCLKLPAIKAVNET